MTSRRHMLVLAIVFVLVTLVPTGVSFAQAPAADGVIPDEWIVTFAAPANPNGKALGLTRAHGGQVRHVYSAALNGFSFRGPAAAAAGMARSPLVRSVVPNRAVQATTAPPGVQRIDASHPTDLDAHDYSTGTGIGIAILDTGVGPHTNLDIVGNMGANCMSNPMDPDVGAPVADDNGHGTHAAGSAAGNGNGVIGVAPDAELVAVKVLDQNGSGSWATVICGIDYVTANSPSIQVANMSLSGPGSATSCTDGGLHQALCNSVAAGVVYTIAAGNSDIDVANEVPAAYGNDLGLITTSAYADYDGEPGRNGGCLRFFGLGRQCDDTFAKFSNWGSKVDVVAPGVQVYSTDINGSAYSTKSGTSMAAPHVAGVVALVLAESPSLTPAQVERPTSKKTESALTEAQNAGSGACSNQGTWKNDPDGTAEPLVNAFWAVEAAAGGGSGDPNPPIADDIAADNVPEDSTAGVVVTLSGSDAEVCDLTFAIVSPPAHGSLMGFTQAPSCTSGSQNTDTAQVTYKPDPNFFGDDSFTYSVNDGTMTSLSATATVSVDAVNDRPVANDDNYEVAMNDALDLPAPGVLGNDVDVEGETMSAQLVSGPANAADFTLNADGSFDYTPVQDYSGPDSFTYTANDSQPGSTAAVTIMVTADPDPPDPGLATTVHVADLSGSSTNNGKTWMAEVIVKVENDLNIAEEGVVVIGTWTGTGGTKEPSCTTDSSGVCTVSFSGIRKRNGTATFTVDNLTDTLPYDQDDDVVSSVLSQWFAA